MSLLFFVTCFALYFPVLALTKNSKITLKYVIPLSISIEIIFGYVFYVFGKATLFPFWYIIFVAILNMWGLFKVEKHVLKPFPSLSFFAWIALLVPVLYTRFYYAFKNLAPGNPDTYYHIHFLNTIKSTGFIDQTFYAPGFHLISLPMTFLLSDSFLYRFMGPVLGIFILLGIYLLLRDRLKNQISQYLLILLFCVPVISTSLTLQMIGFWPSGLSFLYFISFLSLLFKKDDFSQKNHLILYSIFLVALSLTVPFLYVQYIPILTIFSIVIWLLKVDQKYKSYLLKFYLLTLVGFIVAIGHVYLMTQVVHKNGSFPEIQFTVLENDQLVTKSNYNSSKLIDANSKTRWKILNQIIENGFVKNNIIPIINTGQDVFRPKGIVPFSKSSVKTYGWIFVSLLVCIYSFYKKNIVWSSIFLFTALYGFANITGIFELGSYRGRSGWYFLILAIFGLSLLFDHLFERYNLERKIYVIQWFLLILFALSFASPPSYNSYYCIDIFPTVSKIVQDNPGKDFAFYTDDYQVDLLSKKIKTIALKDFPDKKLPTGTLVFAIFEKNYCDNVSDGLKTSLANDIGFKANESAKTKEHIAQQRQIDNIKNSQDFAAFTSYIEKSNYSVYKLGN